MNVFYVDKHPVKAAEQMCDKHIVKMILESAQLLSTCHRVLDGQEYYDKTKNGRKIKRWKHPNPNLEPLLYKAGWVKHPSTIWLFESAYNYIWLYKHMMALNEEYKKRYNHTKNHLAIDKLGEVLKHPKPAMPEHCKIPGDAVASYRKYYILEKQRFATWKSPAKVPDWYLKGVKEAQDQAEI
jgi:hypothetical protein